MITNKYILLTVITIILYLGCNRCLAQSLPEYFRVVLENNTRMNDGSYDILLNGIMYNVDIKDSIVKSISRSFLPDSLKTYNKNVMSYLEKTYAAFSLNYDIPNEMTVVDGSWSRIKPPVDFFNIKLDDGKGYTVTIGTNPNSITVSFPLNYYLFEGDDRTTIENLFIEQLVAYKVDTTYKNDDVLVKSDLELIEKNIYVLRGDSYLTENINQNKYYYLSEDSIFSYVFDLTNPLLSFSNLLLADSFFGALINLNIQQHEYGSIYTMTIPLEQLILFCRSQGCCVYWGVSHHEDEKINGTLFFWNPYEGYEHVIRLKCDFNTLELDKIVIEATAMLFVPSFINNNP